MANQLTRAGVEQIRDGARERLAGLMLDIEQLTTPPFVIGTAVVPGGSYSKGDTVDVTKAAAPQDLVGLLARLQADANSMGVILALADDWLAMEAALTVTIANDNDNRPQSA